MKNILTAVVVLAFSTIAFGDDNVFEYKLDAYPPTAATAIQSRPDLGANLANVGANVVSARCTDQTSYGYEITITYTGEELPLVSTATRMANVDGRAWFATREECRDVSQPKQYVHDLTGLEISSATVRAVVILTMNPGDFASMGSVKPMSNPTTFMAVYLARHLKQKTSLWPG